MKGSSRIIPLFRIGYYRIEMKIWVFKWWDSCRKEFGWNNKTISWFYSLFPAICCWCNWGGWLLTDIPFITILLLQKFATVSWHRYSHFTTTMAANALSFKSSEPSEPKLYERPFRFGDPFSVASTTNSLLLVHQIYHAVLKFFFYFNFGEHASINLARSVNLTTTLMSSSHGIGQLSELHFSANNGSYVAIHNRPASFITSSNLSSNDCMDRMCFWSISRRYSPQEAGLWLFV